jgi:hypothetical protein
MQRILENEWNQFKKDNEQSMRQEGIFNVDELIEESIQEYEDEYIELHLQQEQEELENAIARYEASLSSAMCVNCHKTALQPSTRNSQSIALCPNCGFYATENCLAEIDNAAAAHGTTCNGLMQYALEPGTDNSVLGICNICDLWSMFYM